MGARVHGFGRKRVGVALAFAMVLAGLVMVGHATTAPPDVAISMQSFKFIGPDGVDGNVTIPVGTKVTWTMNDGATVRHTTTSDAVPPIWDSGSLSTGQTFSVTFTTVGSFPYHCIFHSFSMFATITVIAPPNPTGVAPAFGAAAGGTNVTITGSGFQAGAAVAFGGVAATNVMIVDANTITATTPAHAPGAVDVVVTNPDTTIGTLATGFGFIAPLPSPLPSVAPVTGANPLPPTRPPGSPNPLPPNPLPPTRPPGGGAGGGGSVSGGNGSVPVPAPAPTPAPLPPRR